MLSKPFCADAGTAMHSGPVTFAVNHALVQVSTPCPGAPVRASDPRPQVPGAVTVQAQEHAPAATLGAPSTTCSVKVAGHGPSPGSKMTALHPGGATAPHPTDPSLPPPEVVASAAVPMPPSELAIVASRPRPRPAASRTDEASGGAGEPSADPDGEPSGGDGDGGDRDEDESPAGLAAPPSPAGAAEPSAPPPASSSSPGPGAAAASAFGDGTPRSGCISTPGSEPTIKSQPETSHDMTRPRGRQAKGNRARGECI